MNSEMEAGALRALVSCEHPLEFSRLVKFPRGGWMPQMARFFSEEASTMNAPMKPTLFRGEFTRMGPNREDNEDQVDSLWR